MSMLIGSNLMLSINRFLLALAPSLLVTCISLGVRVGWMAMRSADLKKSFLDILGWPVRLSV